MSSGGGVGVDCAKTLQNLNPKMFFALGLATLEELDKSLVLRCLLHPPGPFLFPCQEWHPVHMSRTVIVAVSVISLPGGANHPQPRFLSPMRRAAPVCPLASITVRHKIQGRRMRCPVRPRVTQRIV